MALGEAASTMAGMADGGINAIRWKAKDKGGV